MNVHSPVDPVAELAANVALPFEQARAMPKSVYTQQAFLDAEIEKVFSREWYCAGRASTLKEAGDYIAFELAGQPLMVIRAKDGNIRCQSNVCLHRMSTLLEGRGLQLATDAGEVRRDAAFVAEIGFTHDREPIGSARGGRAAHVVA